ncbi:dTDP-4-dehydrorhamnose 3,5-epimerase family protein [Streptantibioticus ferralitis]|uniref:dTDP-4-dehydrorhamnose 3,5-epimerase family protein n=1 Tax=Streptantibioticus ferralitis TaxID=236510 RepID=A0ABT5YY81_9ACTN|nr:dTDP-4-dehydrorhamnose 3,5-epimerase family protein [Streptantibioticus ferralitis]MDF2256514.1 dTDP-4-dehydrorhamnose 3,5-epimerase family protein [Streptantibioticus ferralitis]
MHVRELAVPGSYEFTPELFPDRRGVFVSPMQGSLFRSRIGHEFHVAQTNLSHSSRGVLRGIHFTTAPPGQAKYVYCAHGRALDFVVDIRVGSPTFGKWDCVELDAQSFRAVYLPIGVGHTFLALEDDTMMSYLMSTSYVPELEQAIDPFDPTLALPWPKEIEFIVSDRDRVAMSLNEALEKGLLPKYEECVDQQVGA